MLRLHDFLPSGNGYKVRLLLTQLSVPFQRIEVDILKGESRTPEFLAKNPNGRIPVLELEDGRCLPESNAILGYLAEGTPFMPADPWERAQMYRWMFFEQYSHEPYLATSRFWLQHGQAEEKADELARRREPGLAALGAMQGHLAQRDFFVGSAYSIADIALYAYTHVAPEGGFALEPYPAVRAWIERVAAQPRHVPITEDVGK